MSILKWTNQRTVMTSEVKIRETDDGDLYFTLPDDVYERLDWREGDELIWDWQPKHNSFILKKCRFESVELDLDDETFTGVAKLAHDNDVTFNRQIEMIMKEFISQHEQVADSENI